MYHRFMADKLAEKTGKNTDLYLDMAYFELLVEFVIFFGMYPQEMLRRGYL